MNAQSPAQQPASRTRNFFTLLKQALAGHEGSYTTGSINKAIFLLSVPMVLEMAMESLFSVVDVYFVSGLGKAAVATVGLTESMLTIVYSLAMGLGMGATALVARRTGEQEHDKAAHAGAQALYLGIFLSLIISFIGLFFSRDLLRLMGAGEEIISEHYRYVQIMLGGNLVIVLLFLINGVFRGAGNAAISMRSLWLANGLNILLCPAFIRGFWFIPPMGLEGAAIATTIGRGAGVLYQFYHLFFSGKGLTVLRRHIGFDPAIVIQLIKVSAGGAAQFLIGSASWIFLIRILSSFGESVLAGYTIAIRVIVFAILPAWGMANAAATLVGQNLGAGEQQRAERSVWRAAFFNLIFLGSIGILFIAFAPEILQQFTTDPEVISTGVLCLRWVSAGYIFYAYGMVLLQAFNGAGDTVTPTIINVCGFWAFQIPLAYMLAKVLAFGPQGVFMAIPIAESAMAIVAILIFRRGRWKQVKV